MHAGIRDGQTVRLASQRIAGSGDIQDMTANMRRGRNTPQNFARREEVAAELGIPCVPGILAASGRNDPWGIQWRGPHEDM
ncbi:hypothetical protein NITHO_2690009 [Nitrolancea hollandica Lb]|uniref:Uncharacterized protein n=1 Tax=Nitrolancea hollandica Lb TaxID=1129897 RepID=I4EGC8_9BACT|nr:hypothetical protein NITHO_2690009 [Nitrolancea hollandica Lb]